jgi:hypothetical protein
MLNCGSQWLLGFTLLELGTDYISCASGLYLELDTDQSQATEQHSSAISTLAFKMVLHKDANRTEFSLISRRLHKTRQASRLCSMYAISRAMGQDSETDIHEGRKRSSEDSSKRSQASIS